MHRIKKCLMFGQFNTYSEVHQLLLTMKSIDHDPGPGISWYCIDLLFCSPVRKQMNTYGNVINCYSQMCLLCLN